MNYYQILNVAYSANSKDIHKSYIRLAKLYHPDMTNNTDENIRKMQEINNAYETLKDPDKRKAYDCKIGIESSNFNQQNEPNDKDTQEEAEYKSEAEQMWKDINSYYTSSKAGYHKDESLVSKNSSSHFPFFYSIWFILLVVTVYMPYSIFAALLLDLARYTELKGKKHWHKKITDIVLLLLLIFIGIYYLFFDMSYRGLIDLYK